MMTAIWTFAKSYLDQVGLDAKNLIRSTLGMVYFVIHKYIPLVFDRTQSEYVY